MSKISITPNATGTGVFTISSPATNTNRTLTLPDADLNLGNVLTSASSIPTSALTGNIIPSGVPAFSVHANGNNISNATTSTVPFSNVLFDTEGNFNISTYRYTPTTAGYYFLSFTYSTDNAGGGEAFSYILKNASGTLVYDFTTSAFWAMTGTTLYYANGTTDYFSVQAYQSCGSTRAYIDACRFHGFLVGAA
jgi:hypothetical protein